MDDPRQQIIETCRVLFARNLSDTVGGNLSVRTGDLVYMTPRYLGSRFHWNIRPDQVLVVDPSRRVVEGEGELSRESALHFGIYDAFPQAGAIVHAHPYYCLVYASAGKPIPPFTEATDIFGEIPLAQPAPAETPELAANATAVLREKAQELERHPLAVLLPRHGIVVVGRTLEAAFDALDRIETSARCHLLSRLFQL